ncbi:hypothetical protein Plhal304r1_c007g0027121 [Plasmopara halstedii]
MWSLFEAFLHQHLQQHKMLTHSKLSCAYMILVDYKTSFGTFDLIRIYFNNELDIYW